MAVPHINDLDLRLGLCCPTVLDLQVRPPSYPLGSRTYEYPRAYRLAFRSEMRILYVVPLVLLSLAAFGMGLTVSVKVFLLTSCVNHIHSLFRILTGAPRTAELSTLNPLLTGWLTLEVATDVFTAGAVTLISLAEFALTQTLISPSTLDSLGLKDPLQAHWKDYPAPAAYRCPDW